MKFFSMSAWSASLQHLIFIGLIFLCGGCGKQKNTPLAQTYFKMAFLELSEQPDQQASLKRALVHLDCALQQEKKPEYYALKATLLFRLGDYQISRQCYQQALALCSDEPMRAEIENNYACLLAQLGQGADAQKIWKSLVGNVAYQTPEVAWVNLGKAYVADHDFVKAGQALQTAVDLEPSYLDAHYYLAVVAQQLGDESLARQQLDLVLLQAPEHEGAAVLARRLGQG